MTATMTAPPTDPPAPTPPAATGGEGLTRLSVNITPRSVAALEQAAAQTGHSKTDCVNRALQVYKVILDLMEEGGGRLNLTDRDGKQERLYII
jgi:hypothetical protein